ncbi:TPM domain-containing protein [Ottowia testudinis]|uniref:TPM domain-containing protein n=1 Tax=Ottowia testudinis TaxID=2816950 RepID=A0A975CG74_9BURK|nr:TPM domain-containing protein [Ottowia testudinis]QTD45207.1 TPM domain-containing protein [Ottowia testudinis]
MLQTLTRLIRHRWLDHTDARRAVPAPLAEQLRRRVAASEQRHSGEVRICVEGGLPTSYLWRHLRDGVPMQHIVRQRALMMFAKLRVWDTHDNNGVLIYLLLAENAIELVADRGVARHVEPAVWQAVVAHLGEELRQGHFEEGLTRALEEVSAVLVAHFPQADDGTAPPAPNQLPDEPVLR